MISFFLFSLTSFHLQKQAQVQRLSGWWLGPMLRNTVDYQNYEITYCLAYFSESWAKEHELFCSIDTF